MNGFQLLRAVKRINADLPVVFITGFAHFRRFFADKTARADGFLEKPFSLEAIDSLVKKFI
jgi:DNA-binding NtrC family response regulator